MINCKLKKNKNNPKCKSVGEAEFSLVLPKRDNSGRKIDNKVHTKFISRMNKRFGGTTTNPNVLGCFKSKEKGKLQCEENIEINTVRDFDNPFDNSLKNLSNSQKERKLQEDFRFMKRLGKKATEEFGQEGVFVKFDRIEDATFITGKRLESLPDKKIFDDVFSREV